MLPLTFYILAQFPLKISTRSLGALRTPSSSWMPFVPLDFFLRALWALSPCDPHVSDWISVLAFGQCVSPWIVCQPLDSVLALGQCVSRWIVCQPLDSVLALGQCVSPWIVCQPLDSFLVCRQCFSLWIMYLDSVLTFGQCVSPWIVCQPLDSVLAVTQCVSRWIVCQPLHSVLALDFLVMQEQKQQEELRILGVRI